MDATQYVTTQAGTGVAIRLPEGFRFRDGREVWRELHPEEWPYREYVLDFGGMSTISDCGIAWLRFFLGWAQAAQVTVRLANVSEALAARLMDAERLSEGGSARPAPRAAPDDVLSVRRDAAALQKGDGHLFEASAPVPAVRRDAA